LCWPTREPDAPILDLLYDTFPQKTRERESGNCSSMILSTRYVRNTMPVLLLAVACLTNAAVLMAQRPISGRIINGTTNRPAAQQKVELLTLGEGMKTASEALSSADGSFSFPAIENTQTPHLLLRAIYQGVNYNLSVSSHDEMDKPVTLTIYETTQKSDEIKVSLPVMLAQASGNALLVQQQYLLANETNPRKTLVSSTGTFLFDTPPSAISELSVAVVGLAGIPLPQTPTSRSEGGYQISYPMKPGVNEIRISYRVNFPTSQRDLKHRLFYGTKAARILVLPPNLQVSGAQLKSEGKDSRTQAAAYQTAEIPKGGFLNLSILGEAPEVSAPDETGGESETAQPQVKVVRLSNPVFEKKEIVLGSLGILFALAITYALRQRSHRSGASPTAAKPGKT